MKPKTKQSGHNLPVPNTMIERRIYIIRGQKVMLDSDLAGLYQIATRILNQAVRRNLDRFPVDFMFQLNKSELKNWMSQIVTSNPTVKMSLRKGPLAFTEHGIAMLSSVLKSKRAVQMNILIIRAFIKMRQMLAANQNLEKRLDKVEDLQKLHHKVITMMAEDIKKIKNPPKTNLIGFQIK